MMLPKVRVCVDITPAHPHIRSGTLKIVQNFMSENFSSFTKDTWFVDGPVHLRLQVLDLVSTYCSERSAALRLVDLPAIWTFLSYFLAPSPDHDAETNPAVFQTIVAIVSALIRLRRDLVTNHLPLLSHVLRQLILCMRSSQLQLGGKQTKLIADSLPRWISTNSPLGVDEAKVLARLLTTLTTKTMTRTFQSPTENQKAESLAKPFSKHAAYVLQAYLVALNDPLCVLPAPIRRELQPGLFALCNMMNDHSRDALMVSALDAGGKTALKSLWRDYQKQKYVGKG